MKKDTDDLAQLRFNGRNDLALHPFPFAIGNCRENLNGNDHYYYDYKLVLIRGTSEIKGGDGIKTTKWVIHE